MTETNARTGQSDTSPQRARGNARRIVLDAAAEVFVERGFEGASIDLIAQRARVSKPTIYSHFAGKNELFVEILGEVCDNLAAPMVGDAAEKADLVEVLLSIARAYGRSVLKPQVVALHRLFVAEAERFPDLSRRYYEAGPARAHRSFSDFLSSRMEKGEIARQDPHILADFFAAMVINPIRMKLLFAVETDYTPEELDRYCSACVDLFLNGCRATEGE